MKSGSNIRFNIRYMIMKPIHKKSETAPFCDCNCGQPVERNKITGKWNKYLHGHNSRSSSNNDNKFKPGNTSGRGRPEGSRNRVTISAMNMIKDEEQALSRQAIDSALNGNVQMLQFCLSRILPPPPKDNMVKLDGMPQCNDMNSALSLSSYILEKLADGSVTPSQAHLISGLFERHLRCLQVTEVEQRLSLIEQKIEQQLKP